MLLPNIFKDINYRLASLHVLCACSKALLFFLNVNSFHSSYFVVDIAPKKVIHPQIHKSHHTSKCFCKYKIHQP